MKLLTVIRRIPLLLRYRVDADAGHAAEMRYDDDLGLNLILKGTETTPAVEADLQPTHTLTKVANEVSDRD
jgi:hypothetical protein